MCRLVGALYEDLGWPSFTWPAAGGGIGEMYPRLLVFRDALTWMLSAWLADPITDPGARRQDGKIAFIKCDDCSDGVRRIIRSGTAGVRMSARSSLVAIGFPAAGAA